MEFSKTPESEEKKMTTKSYADKSKGGWNALAEVLLMGAVIPVETKEQVQYITNYVLNVLGHTECTAEEVLKMATQFTKNEEFKSMSLNRIAGMKMLAITFITDEDREDPNFKYCQTSEQGVFGYVYNIDALHCSELGYTYYANDNGRLHRIG